VVDIPSPFGLPEKVFSRLAGDIKALGGRIDALGAQLQAATESWGEMARMGAEGAPLIRMLDERSDSLRRLIDRGPAALDAAIKLEARSDEMLEVANRTIDVLEQLIATIESASKHVDPLVSSIDDASQKVDPLIASIDAAREKVDPLVGTLDASLPALEKAVNLVGPLEGSVQRLGRVLDGRSKKAGRGGDATGEEAPIDPSD